MKSLQNIFRLSSSLQLFNSLHVYTQGVCKYNEHTLNKQLPGLSVSFHTIIFYEMYFLDL